MDDYEGWWVKYLYSSSQGFYVNKLWYEAEGSRWSGDGYGSRYPSGNGWGDDPEGDGTGDGHSDIIVEYREDL